MTDVLPLSLKLANKKRKATATNVMNRAAVQAAWGALGLSLTPSAYIKKGHSNGNMRGVGASKSVIRDNCILDMDRDLIDVAKCRKHQVFFGNVIEKRLKSEPTLKLYRCPVCSRGPYTNSGLGSHKIRCAKAIKYKPQDAAQEMEKRSHAIRRNQNMSTTRNTDRTRKSPKKTSASAPGFNKSADRVSNNSIVASNDDMDQIETQETN